MRKRIKTAAGRTTKTAPWLLAMFTAVALAVTSAVPSLQAENAVADDVGGLCQSQELELGENISVNEPDTGVATWVGRDMYVGGRPLGTDININGETNKPTKSFVAEVEGLTLVRGKLAVAKDGGSWDGNGLRMGAVGFGSMFRPNKGQPALGVGGIESNIASMTTGGKTGNVGAWKEGTGHKGGAFVGFGKSGEGIWFKALITGEATKVEGNADRDSVVGDGWQNTSQGKVEWGKSVTTTTGADGKTTYSAEALTIGSTDYTNWTGTYVKPTSDTLNQIDGYGSVAAEDQSKNPGVNNSTTAPAGVYYGKGATGSVTLSKYNNAGVNYKFDYSSDYTTNLITFQGDGTSTMQVFELPASKLNQKTFFDGSTGTVTGVEFAFSNIPSGASVVVNVVNDTEESNTPISFHTGWRFYWKGKNIQGSWTSKEYGEASQAIMWNFRTKDAGHTPALQIYGGAFNKADNSHDKGPTDLGDDPAAAMLGSIMVPEGSFDDHVSTNGRVYVGKDLMLNNPTWVAKGSDYDGASVIGMDQERHNFPWHGAVRSTCSTISWVKTGPNGSPYDQTTGATLSGSGWGVYATLQNAQNETGALYNVQDNNAMTGDWNPVGGRFRVDNLKPGFTYYIRENIAPAGYKLTDHIFAIKATESGSTSNKTISQVWLKKSGAWKELTEETQWPIVQVQAQDSSQGTVQGIVNPSSGGSVNWGKFAEGDNSHRALENSVWSLYKVEADGNKTPLADIDDNTAAPTGINIKRDGEDVTGQKLNVMENDFLRFTAEVTPSGTPQGVRWTTNTDSDKVGIQDGRVIIYEVPEGNSVTITATSAEVDTVTASVTLNITPVPCEKLSLQYNGTTYDDDSLVINMGMQQTAQVNTITDPENMSVFWESGDENVVKVEHGELTPVGAGRTTVTVRCKDKTRTFRVVVSSGTTVYVNVEWTNPTVYWWGVDGLTSPDDFSSAPSMTKIEGCGNWYEHTFFVSQKTINFNIANNHAVGDKYEVNNYRDASSGDIKITKDDGSEYTNITVGGASSTYKIDRGDISTGAPECPASAVPEPSSSVYAPQGLSDVRDPQEEDVIERRVMRRAMLNSTNTSVMNSPATRENSQYQDQDFKTGRFRIDGLPNGNTYILKEKVAPSGYWLNPTEYKFTMVDGQPQWDENSKPNMVGNTGWISDPPTVVEWLKVDETTNQALGGTVWSLEQKNAEGTWTMRNSAIADCEGGDCSANAAEFYDEDPNIGTLRITKLPIGEYRIKELPRDGYEQNDTEYTFEITRDKPNAGTATIAPKEIANTRKLGTLKWQKRSSDATVTEPLAGSEWELTFVSHDNAAKTAECTITDESTTCTTSNSNVVANWTDNNSAAGVFEYLNLPWGTYTLQETKAPDGYNLNSEVRTFVIGPKGDSYVLEQDYGSIENTPGVVLPETGGEGSSWVVMLGFAFTAIAMLGCGLALSRRTA